MNGPKVTFQMLQERFVAGLDRRVAQLSANLATLAGSAGQSSALETVEEMTRGFHSLAGIGGSYGFHQITDVARIGETACEVLDGDITAPDLRLLAEIIDSLQFEASKSRPGSRHTLWTGRPPRDPLVSMRRQVVNDRVASPANEGQRNEEPGPLPPVRGRRPRGETEELPEIAGEGMASSSPRSSAARSTMPHSAFLPG